MKQSSSDSILDDDSEEIELIVNKKKEEEELLEIQQGENGQVLATPNNIENFLRLLLFHKKKQQEEKVATPPPSLSTMPSDTMLVNIFEYIAHNDNLPTFLALDRTCQSLHNLLGGTSSDDTWGKLFPTALSMTCSNKTSVRDRVFIEVALEEIRKEQKSTENIILEYLGGADGVRRIVGDLIRKGQSIHEKAHFEPMLRGDSIYYLVEVIQAHIISQLQKANNILLHKSYTIGSEWIRIGGSCVNNITTLAGYSGEEVQDFPYPVLSINDLLMVDVLSDDVSCFGMGNRSSIASISIRREALIDDEQILGSEVKRRMVRALAYRAGIVMLSGNAFSLIANTVLWYLDKLTAKAFVVSRCVAESQQVKELEASSEESLDEEGDDEEEDEGEHNGKLPPN